MLALSACGKEEEKPRHKQTCDAHAQKIDGACTCDDGYAGNGTHCTEIDECAEGTDNCGDHGACVNTAGSFTCDCDDGYGGNTCTDLDECDLGTDNCGAHSTCTNTPGSFTCECNRGYTGDGLTCESDCEVPTDKATIQAAVNDGACAIIPVLAGTYFEHVSISRDVEIVGEGSSTTFVDGSNSGRPFTLNSSGVTLRALTIVHGSASEGGGIYGGNGTSLALEDVTVSGNSAAGGTYTFGGGISFRGNALGLVRSQVEDNTLSANGSFSFGMGGGIALFPGMNPMSVAIIQSRISGNTITSSAGIVAYARGGGLYAGGGPGSGATITIDDSLLSANSATAGAGTEANGVAGAIDLEGGLLVATNSTISGNTATGSAGISYVWAGGIHAQGDVSLYNCTVAFNTLVGNYGSAAGIQVDEMEGSLTLGHTIVSNNSGAEQCEGYMSATVTSLGYNLFGPDFGCTVSGETTGNLTDAEPNLGTLQDNGGPTFTHAIPSDSPAHNAGNPGGCFGADDLPLTTDQRGLPRPVDTCDIGAFEVQ